MMMGRRVGSIIVVDDNRHPVGIMTDSDLRDKVVSQAIDAGSTPVSAVMTSPVSCVMEPQTVSQLVAIVMQKGLHHFCFTRDGTAESPLVGVLSEHDLITAHGNHPTVLRQKIARTRDPDRLLMLRDKAEQLVQQYLQQEASMSLICSVISGINDALIRSSIAIAQTALREEGRSAPEEPFCWLSLGSEGREEQLLRTDLDNAIVYADPPEERAEQTAAYYLALGEKTNDLLMHTGFERCPGNIMASNPELNLPLSKWKQKFSKLIRTPEPKALMYANIFFDLRGVDGDEALVDQLTRHIFDEIDKEPMFLTFSRQERREQPAAPFVLSRFRARAVRAARRHVRHQGARDDADRRRSADPRVRSEAQVPWVHAGALRPHRQRRARARAARRRSRDGVRDSDAYPRLRRLSDRDFGALRRHRPSQQAGASVAAQHV